MLTADKEVNRDFNVNNLFLNLDFQHQEETFEYKWPLLDHPSNYQLIITNYSQGQVSRTLNCMTQKNK